MLIVTAGIYGICVDKCVCVHVCVYIRTHWFLERRPIYPYCLHNSSVSCKDRNLLSSLRLCSPPSSVPWQGTAVLPSKAGDTSPVK